MFTQMQNYTVSTSEVTFFLKKEIKMISSIRIAMKKKERLEQGKYIINQRLLFSETITNSSRKPYERFYKRLKIYKDNQTFKVRAAKLKVGKSFICVLVKEIPIKKRKRDKEQIFEEVKMHVSARDKLQQFEQKCFGCFFASNGKMGFIVLEYCENSLDSYLRHFPRLKIAERIELIYQLCQVLTIFESMGFIHFNLNPENIFVKNGRIKIGGFSYSFFKQHCKKRKKEFHKARRSSFKRNKSIKLLPSHFFGLKNNKKILKNADQYSFGILLYYIFWNMFPPMISILNSEKSQLTAERQPMNIKIPVYFVGLMNRCVSFSEKDKFKHILKKIEKLKGKYEFFHPIKLPIIQSKEE